MAICLQIFFSNFPLDSIFSVLVRSLKVFAIFSNTYCPHSIVPCAWGTFKRNRFKLFLQRILCTESESIIMLCGNIHLKNPWNSFACNVFFLLLRLAQHCGKGSRQTADWTRRGVYLSKRSRSLGANSLLPLYPLLGIDEWAEESFDRNFPVSRPFYWGCIEKKMNGAGNIGISRYAVYCVLRCTPASCYTFEVVPTSMPQSTCLVHPTSVGTCAFDFVWPFFIWFDVAAATHDTLINRIASNRSNN